VCHNQKAHTTFNRTASKPNLVDLAGEGTAAEATTPLSKGGEHFLKHFYGTLSQMNFLTL